MCLAEALLESVSLSVGPLDVVTRPRLWLKTTSEKGPHLSRVVFQTRVGFLTGGRKKSFLALPEEEQMQLGHRLLSIHQSPNE